MSDFYTTADDAKDAIADAIEAGGEASRDDYDIEAIFEAVFEWEDGIDDTGRQWVQDMGWRWCVDDDEFWSVVSRHEIAK